MMKLIYAKDTCALSVHILLEELKASYQAIKVSLEDKSVLESYNPKSYVPALVLDDGQVLTEATVILQYIAENSHSSFIPSEPFARTRCLEMLTYISCELHKAMAPLFVGGDLPESYLKSVKQKLSHRLQHIEDLMADRAFLLGQEYTIADMYFLAILRLLDHQGVELSEFKEISNFKKNLEANSLIQGVLRTESEAEVTTELAETIDTSIFYQESTSIHLEN